MVRVSGFLNADSGDGQWTFVSTYLAHHETDVYTFDEVSAHVARLAEWGATHGRDSYTFGGGGGGGAA
jgi:hypothetical protein